MLPLAYALGKLFNTSWKIENNRLNDLGLWLNMAQLFYFPLLFVVISKDPKDLPMALGIITGAHFFPYAWFYQTKAYAVIAGLIAIGAALIPEFDLEKGQALISAWIVLCLWFLAIWIYKDYLRFSQSNK